MSENGLITIASHHSVKETMDRLEASLMGHGVTIFARIDHAGGAMEAGLELRPTELIAFGNPKNGTPLMQAKQTMGLDLPLRMLGWQDADGRTWLTYNDMHWVAKRHGMGAEAASAVTGIADLLTKLAETAAA